MANTINDGVYKEEWETRLQTRLDRPQNWNEVCDVIFTDSRLVHVPYMSTEFSAQTHTRGTAYGFSDFTLSDETISVSTQRVVPVYVDHGDFAQCDYVTQMEIADRQAALIGEHLEVGVLDDHANWTNVGDSGGVVTSGVTTQITVTATNIDDIVRGIRRIITVANGTSLARQNGIFFVWRPQDFEALEQFAQANGFNLADAALKNGIDRGYFLLGAYHYVSNDNVANHVFAGVRKIMKLAILRSTYGRLYTVPEPANGDGQLSGTGFYNRVDYGTLTPTGLNTILFDINVSS